MLDEIEPENEIEEYQVFILELTLAHYLDMELNEDEKEQVTEIANLKVWEAGPVVYAARNMVGLELLDTEEEEEDERMANTTAQLTKVDDNNITLVPNPANDILNVMNLPDNSKVHIVIRDYTGKMVADAYNKTLSLEKIINGVYAVEIIADDNHVLTVKKLVVLK